MAKSENVYIAGVLSWVRHATPDQWGNYKGTIHPNAESLEIARELAAQGVKNVIKKDENGYNVTYRRPTQKLINGKVSAFGPVILLDGSKQNPDGSYPPLSGDVAIGNGSEGVMKLQVYEHRIPGTEGKKSKAARLESIRIDKLIPFERAGDFTEEELRATKGLSSQPTAESPW